MENLHLFRACPVLQRHHLVAQDASQSVLVAMHQLGQPIEKEHCTIWQHKGIQDVGVDIVELARVKKQQTNKAIPTTKSR